MNDFNVIISYNIDKKLEKKYGKLIKRKKYEELKNKVFKNLSNRKIKQYMDGYMEFTLEHIENASKFLNCTKEELLKDSKQVKRLSERTKEKLLNTYNLSHKTKKKIKINFTFI